LLLARGIPEDNYAQSKEAEDLQNLCYNNLGIQIILTKETLKNILENDLKRNIKIFYFPSFSAPMRSMTSDPKLFFKSVLIIKI